jgi:hypothetical protein
MLSGGSVLLYIARKVPVFPEPKKIEVLTARLKQRNLLPDESLIIKKDIAQLA